MNPLLRTVGNNIEMSDLDNILVCQEYHSVYDLEEWISALMDINDFVLLYFNRPNTYVASIGNETIQLSDKLSTIIYRSILRSSSDNVCMIKFKDEESMLLAKIVLEL